MSDFANIADLLARGWEPDEITPEVRLRAALIRMVQQVVEAELAARNLDRPNSNGDYDPRWYVAQSILTGITESLRGIALTVADTPDE